MVTAYQRGHKTYWDDKIKGWCYLDDGSRADYERPCTQCHKLPTKEGYDACLGHIPGVKSACCGHGVEIGYVVWETTPIPEKAKWGGWYELLKSIWGYLKTWDFRRPEQRISMIDIFEYEKTLLYLREHGSLPVPVQPIPNAVGIHYTAEEWELMRGNRAKAKEVKDRIFPKVGNEK